MNLTSLTSFLNEKNNYNAKIIRVGKRNTQLTIMHNAIICLIGHALVIGETTINVTEAQVTISGNGLKLVSDMITVYIN